LFAYVISKETLIRRNSPENDEGPWILPNAAATPTAYRFPSAGAGAELVRTAPLRRPVRNTTNGTYFLRSYTFSPAMVSLLVFVWMSMAPIPVVRLLLPVRLREFARILVIFREVLPPGAIFVVIPVVIILVVSIIDANLNVGLLRYGAGHNGHWRRKGGGQE
jgi:hypothetical protein